jgi:hypothetical protein
MKNNFYNFSNHQTEKIYFQYAKLLEKRYPNPKNEILLKILSLYVESVLLGHEYLQLDN